MRSEKKRYYRVFNDLRGVIIFIVAAMLVMPPMPLGADTMSRSVLAPKSDFSTREKSQRQQKKAKQEIRVYVKGAGGKLEEKPEMAGKSIIEIAQKYPDCIIKDVTLKSEGQLYLGVKDGKPVYAFHRGAYKNRKGVTVEVRGGEVASAWDGDRYPGLAVDIPDRAVEVIWVNGEKKEKKEKPEIRVYVRGAGGILEEKPEMAGKSILEIAQKYPDCIIKDATLNSEGQLRLGKKDGKPVFAFTRIAYKNRKGVTVEVRGGEVTSAWDGDRYPGLVVDSTDSAVEMIWENGEKKEKPEIRVYVRGTGGILEEKPEMAGKSILEIAQKYPDCIIKDATLNSEGQLRLGKKDGKPVFVFKRGARKNRQGVTVEVRGGEVTGAWDGDRYPGLTVNSPDHAVEAIWEKEKPAIRVYVRGVAGKLEEKPELAGKSILEIVKEHPDCIIKDVTLGSEGQLYLGRKDGKKVYAFGRISYSGREGVTVELQGGEVTSAWDGDRYPDLTVNSPERAVKAIWKSEEKKVKPDIRVYVRGAGGKLEEKPDMAGKSIFEIAKEHPDCIIKDVTLGSEGQLYLGTKDDKPVFAFRKRSYSGREGVSVELQGGEVTSAWDGDRYPDLTVGSPERAVKAIWKTEEKKVKPDIRVYVRGAGGKLDEKPEMTGKSIIEIAQKYPDCIIKDVTLGSVGQLRLGKKDGKPVFAFTRIAYKNRKGVTVEVRGGEVTSAWDGDRYPDDDLDRPDTDVKLIWSGMDIHEKDKLEAYAENKDILDLVAALYDSPRDLDSLLAILHPEIPEPERRQLVIGFAKLNLGKDFSPGSSEGKETEDFWAREAKIVEALFRRMEKLDKLSSEQMAIVMEVYRRKVQKEFERDFDAAYIRYAERIGPDTPDRLRLLYEYVIRYFREAKEFEAIGLRKGAKLHLYQNAGVQFLMKHDQAILADEQGLGKTVQAVAAAETLGLKRVLIVTPNRVKDTWRGIIEKFTNNRPEDIFVVDSKNAREKGGLDKAKTARYVIVNYEFLRGRSKEEFERLFPDLDVVILDEVQKADNPSDTCQQAVAVRQIHPKRKWLLSSTPYNDKPAYLFTLLKYLFPDKYTNFKEFERIYAQDTAGLRLLSRELSSIMLRRRQNEVVYEYNPEIHGPDDFWVPKRNDVSPEKEGNYLLNEEQLKLIRWMLDDFRGWAEWYNSLPGTKKPVHVENINPLMKLAYIIKATIDPRKVGGATLPPVVEKIEKIVEERINAKPGKPGQKVIIFANSTSMVNDLMEKFKKYGVARIDGEVYGYERDKDGNFVLDRNGNRIPEQTAEQRRFQEDPNVRVMVMNIKSGSVGLSLTAADAIIFAEMPMTFTDIYQAIFRAFRVDSRKKQVDIVTMMAKYPEEFINSLEPGTLRESFEAGTVTEILQELIKDKEWVYRLVMEDMEDEAAYDKAIIQGLAGRIPGLAMEEAPKKGRVVRREEVAEEYYQLWTKAKTDAERKAIVDIATNFMRQDLSPQTLLDQIRQIPNFNIADLDIVNTIFDYPNKFLKQQVIKQLPARMIEMYQSGQTMTTQRAAWSIVKERYRYLIVPLIFSTLSWRDGPPVAMTALLEDIFKSGKENDCCSRLFIILSHLIDTQGDHFRKFLDSNKGILSDKAIPLERKLSILERLSIIKRVDRKSYEEICARKLTGHNAMEKLVQERYMAPMMKIFGVPDDPTMGEKILKLYRDWGHFDQIYGLVAALNRDPIKYGSDMKLLKGIMLDILNGTYKERRAKERGIDYLSDEKAFWNEWDKEGEDVYTDVKVEDKDKKRRIFDSWEMLEKWLSESGAATEEEKKIAELDKAEKLEGALNEARDAVQFMGKRYGLMREGMENVYAPGEEKFLKENGLFELVNDPKAYKEKMESIRPVYLVRQYIAKVRLAVEKLRAGEPIERAAAMEDLNRLYRIYQGRHAQKELLDSILQLNNDFQAFEQERVYKKVRIYDTDDPQMILERGELHQRLINCFNYSGGNPEQTHTLVGFLAGKNQRLIIAEDEEHGILSVTAVKVRKDKDGNPSLFLENGIYRGGDDFKEQMLAHLAKKAEKMQPKPSVTYQVRTAPHPDDIHVWATGNVADEYAEALFGVRRANQDINHPARIYAQGGKEEKVVPLNEKPSVIFVSAGHGGKKIEAFIKELKDAGVKTLVDVRSKPASRFQPQFNKKALEASLRAAGIGYVWQGDDLGGFQKGYDDKSGGFKRYMAEDPDGKFTRGIEKLVKIGLDAGGPVAVMCSESDPNKCHRSDILGLLGSGAVKRLPFAKDIDIEVHGQARQQSLFDESL